MLAGGYVIFATVIIARGNVACLCHRLFAGAADGEGQKD
jgi:hypothetical protein